MCCSDLPHDPYAQVLSRSSAHSNGYLGSHQEHPVVTTSFWSAWYGSMSANFASNAHLTSTHAPSRTHNSTLIRAHIQPTALVVLQSCTLLVLFLFSTLVHNTTFPLAFGLSRLILSHLQSFTSPQQQVHMLPTPTTHTTHTCSSAHMFACNIHTSAYVY